MLKRAFNGALTPLMQFLIEHEGLSPKEASQLRELIEKAESEKNERSHTD
jgi:predicted transcriptional regulator